ncbi:MAG: tail fiber domain-containing protein [Acidobacteriota bacterium]|nr:tail fiber domain-containing protein [Acidobacteriota bacterium]
MLSSLLRTVARRNTRSRLLAGLVFGAFFAFASGLIPGSLAGTATAEELVTVHTSSQGLVFQPLADHGTLLLTVAGPDGYSLERTSFRDGVPAIDVSGLTDGVYQWRLQAQPSSATRQRTPEDGERSRRNAGPTPQSGAFSVRDGSVVDSGRVEPLPGAAPVQGGSGPQAATEELFSNNNLYVHNSACIGGDCVDQNENFGLDTLRLKEENLRLHFEDTSNTFDFPTRDWRLLINSNTNGGPDRFSVEDVDAGTVPMTIEGDAPDHALYVTSDAALGLGTNTPGRSIHSTSGNTPGLRLEQDVSRGFSPYTWDVSANEISFHLRDVSNGDTLPFVVHAGAPSNSLVVEADGDVYFGEQASQDHVSLNIRTNDDDNFAGLRVENVGTGNIQTQFANLEDDWEWRQTFREGDMIFDSQEDGANEWELDTDGNVTATSFNPTSDRNLKQGFDAVDPAEVLERLAAIPVTRWSYRGDADATPHIGPVAQDFHAAFGVGADDRHISTTDADGVAFAAIQALYQQLQEARADRAMLLQRLEALERCEP